MRHEIDEQKKIIEKLEQLGFGDFQKLRSDCSINYIERNFAVNIVFLFGWRYGAGVVWFDDDLLVCLFRAAIATLLAFIALVFLGSIRKRQKKEAYMQLLG